MRRLVCAFVVRKPPKTGFLAARPICVKFENLMNPLVPLQKYMLFGYCNGDFVHFNVLYYSGHMELFYGNLLLGV